MTMLPAWIVSVAIIGIVAKLFEEQETVPANSKKKASDAAPVRRKKELDVGKPTDKVVEPVVKPVEGNEHEEGKPVVEESPVVEDTPAVPDTNIGNAPGG